MRRFRRLPVLFPLRAAGVRDRESTSCRAAAGHSERHARTHHGPRSCARGKPRGRLPRPTGRRLSAAQLRARAEPPLPGALLPARLHRDRRSLRQITGDSGFDRPCHRRRRARDDRRHSRRVHQVQRQHVLEFADDRLLGDVRCRRSHGVHRQAVPDHRVERRPRPRRPFDGRLRDDAHRHEAGACLRGALRHELVLPDERSRRRTGRCSGSRRRRTWCGALRAAGLARGLPPAAAAWRTRCPRRRPHGRQTRRTRRSSSTCRRSTARSSRSSPPSGSPTRRSSSSISTCRRSGPCVPSRSMSAIRTRSSPPIVSSPMRSRAWTCRTRSRCTTGITATVYASDSKRTCCHSSPVTSGHQ